jgi:hypothetical protein
MIILVLHPSNGILCTCSLVIDQGTTVCIGKRTDHHPLRLPSLRIAPPSAPAPAPIKVDLVFRFIACPAIAPTAAPRAAPTPSGGALAEQPTLSNDIEASKTTNKQLVQFLFMSHSFK